MNHFGFLQPLTDELLKKADCNVVNVDWGGIFASKTLYTQATANTRVVAAELIHMLNTMRVSSCVKVLLLTIQTCDS